MSSANVRKFDIDGMAERALWFDTSQLDEMFRAEVVPSRGVNKLERADIRNRVRRRIIELRKAARRPATKPRQPVSRNYPHESDVPPPFSRDQLSVAVREIEAEVDRRSSQVPPGDSVPYGVEFSPAAQWMLDRLTRPSCLMGIRCPPDKAVCTRCLWIFTLHSREGRQASHGSMLSVQRDLRLLSL